MPCEPSKPMRQKKDPAKFGHILLFHFPLSTRKRGGLPEKDDGTLYQSKMALGKKNLNGLEPNFYELR